MMNSSAISLRRLLMPRRAAMLSVSVARCADSPCLNEAAGRGLRHLAVHRLLHVAARLAVGQCRGEDVDQQRRERDQQEQPAAQ